MGDREMLSAISGLLDEKLEQKLDQKFDEKLQPVYERLDDLKADVDDLENDMRYVTETLLEKCVMPQLSRIESRYLEAFHRYVEHTEKFYKMVADIKILKNVVAEHSRRLEKIPG